MSIKRFFLGYKDLFSFLGRFFVLLVFCALISFGVVYPLWKFAVSAPLDYTVSVIVVLAVIVFIVLFFRIKKYIDEDTTQARNRIQSLIYGVIKCVFIIFMIALFLFFLFIGSRRLALAMIPVALLLYGIARFVGKKT